MKRKILLSFGVLASLWGANTALAATELTAVQNGSIVVERWMQNMQRDGNANYVEVNAASPGKERVSNVYISSIYNPTAANPTLTQKFIGAIYSSNGATKLAQTPVIFTSFSFNPYANPYGTGWGATLASNQGIATGTAGTKYIVALDAYFEGDPAQGGVYNPATATMMPLQGLSRAYIHVINATTGAIVKRHVMGDYAVGTLKRIEVTDQNGDGIDDLVVIWDKVLRQTLPTPPATVTNTVVREVERTVNLTTGAYVSQRVFVTQQQY